MSVYLPLFRLRISQAPMFQGFSRDQIELLLESTHFVKCESGDILIREGDQPDRMMILLSGSVDVMRTTEHGDTFVLRRLYPPTTLGYCRLADRAYSADIVSSDNTIISSVPLGLVKSTLSENPDAMFTAIRHLSELVDNLTTEKIELKDLPLIDRIVRVLRSICDSEAVSRISHEELAQMVGGNRANVSRALKSLEHSEVVELGRRSIRLKISSL